MKSLLAEASVATVIISSVETSPLAAVIGAEPEEADAGARNEADAGARNEARF